MLRIRLPWVPAELGALDDGLLRLGLRSWRATYQVVSVTKPGADL